MLSKILYTEKGEFTEEQKKALDIIAYKIKELFEEFKDQYDNVVINHLIQGTSNAEQCQRDLTEMCIARRNKK